MKTKNKKPTRPRAETPKGFRDYEVMEVLQRADMLKAISEVYHRYGFDALETPAVENVEALGKFLPDIDRPNEGVFSWLDESDHWLALRYDLTAPLARYYAQYRSELPLPYRRYAMGPVWRNEKPGPGRFKQFYQCDADSVGAPTVAADAEMCLMLNEILENVGIPKSDYVVKVNNRKILDGILEKIGLNHLQDEKAFISKRDIVLRTIDKLDRLGPRGVEELLGSGREDESGDYLEGADLTKNQSQLIMEFLEAKNVTTEETIKNLKGIVKGSEIGLAGVAELEKIFEVISASEKNCRNIFIDPTTVRGLGYYTGPVLEAELTFNIIDHKGRKRQFGSVAGGGRYDNLIKRFTGQVIPATGVSIGVDRLMSALNDFKKSAGKMVGPVVVTVMDPSYIKYYQSIVEELRTNNIRAEMFIGKSKDFGKQLKYADQRQSPIALIVGSEEIARNIVQLKDLTLGTQLSKSITSNEEWKSRPAQLEVPRSELLDNVRTILSKYSG
tara:strand:+ start:230 stop:1732 length:1503 start_codon:yes stop_codon:yes gene_type:complete